MISLIGLKNISEHNSSCSNREKSKEYYNIIFQEFLKSIISHYLVEYALWSICIHVPQIKL